VSRIVLLAVLGLMLTTLPAAASANYTGYSGAPGSRGSCASSCHGRSGGTIQVNGFPATYVPGQAYVISVRHDGGSTIRNFNGSVRVGSGSETAGEIAAGLNTSTYSVGQEPNGVHLSSSQKDTATFTWTAPDPGVGMVRLYLAGLQGSQSGSNTEIVLTSDQGTGVAEPVPGVPAAFGLRAEPSVVTGRLVLRFRTPAGSDGSLLVADAGGRVVLREHVAAGAGEDQVLAVGLPEDLANGRYLAAVFSDGERDVTGFVLDR
jgi:hypothetical protein